MEDHVDRIRQLVLDLKFTYKQVRTHLIEEVGLPPRGLSERSIRRFCLLHDVHRTAHKTPKEVRECQVRIEHKLAGPSCGRVFVHGLLQSRGVNIGLATVGKTLKVVDPLGNERRYRGLARKTNPPLYKADYFGQKIHFDQNEKLAMFGVTHVVAVDGYSRYIVGHSTMPTKNNTTIYDEIYRPVVLTHGVWDTLRLDGGNEFNLIEYAQTRYSLYRFQQRRPAVSRGKSTQNHIVERVWPEINRLINYPLKTCLRDMWHADDIDMDDPRDKYIVSAISRVLQDRHLTRMVGGWNHRYIQGRGCPNLLRRQVGQELGRQARRPTNMPQGAEMVDQYIREINGNFKDFPKFGETPFPTLAAEQEWWSRVKAEYPDEDLIWEAANDERYVTVANYYIRALNLVEQVLADT